jgi:hypothetical protein
LGSIIFNAPFFTSVSPFTSTPIGDHNDHRAQYFTVIGIDVWANEDLELWANQMGRNFCRAEIVLRTERNGKFDRDHGQLSSRFVGNTHRLSS